SPALEVGQGDKAASLRFGSGAILGPEAIESLIGCIRAALADDTAHVSMSVRAMEFATGHDLSEILAEFEIKPAAGEVEQ
ncbi:MAG: hypothetical protein ACREYF_01920, partial [Gammaproteobacteria bacterium]